MGLDVGVFGRWSRLLWGVAIRLPFAFGEVRNLLSPDSPPTFYGLAGTYFVGIGAAQVSFYWAFGERFFARTNPWINTVVFAGPAFAVAWWELLFRPLAGLAFPSALFLGMTAYIGISFILQWKIRYGGCEVVALTIPLSKRRYTTYRLPLVAVDAVEKLVVERIVAPGDAR